MDTEIKINDALRARCRALADGLSGLSGLFWKTPEQSWKDILEDLAVLGKDTPQYMEGLAARDFQACLKLTAKLLDGPFADVYALEHLWLRLFVTCSGCYAAPPYESAWTESDPKLAGAAAEAMRARLDAEDLDLEEGATEPADHICVEVDYLCHLLEKALENDDPSKLAEAADFSGIIMLPWVNKFADRLREDAPHSLFELGAVALTAALTTVSTLPVPQS